MSVLEFAIFGGAFGAITAAINEFRKARDKKRLLAKIGEFMGARIDQIKEAIEVMHHCKAVHLESVPVVEMFGDKPVWDGVVEVFYLTGHPKANRCYAWSFPEGSETRFVTVLEIPPVESAQTAVRVSIASEQHDS